MRGTVSSTLANTSAIFCYLLVRLFWQIESKIMNKHDLYVQVLDIHSLKYLSIIINMLIPVKSVLVSIISATISSITLDLSNISRMEVAYLTNVSTRTSKF